MKFGIEVQVCTTFANLLYFTCEIAMAKMAGRTEQQMFSEEIASVLRMTLMKSAELVKMRSKYLSPTNSHSHSCRPGE